MAQCRIWEHSAAASAKPSGINLHNTVVGYSDTSSGQSDAFVVASAGGHMGDLNSLIPSKAASLYTLQEARGVNANGQIVANGVVKASGAFRAFLPSPRKKSQDVDAL